MATPMGANLVAGGGATFRVWAPHAHSVRVVGDVNELLVNDGHGYWAGFVANAREGQRYMFHVVGEGSEGEKRDPYARELTPEWPNSQCVIRDPHAYAWRSDAYRTPRFEDFVVYQLHAGAFDGPDRPHRVAKFLDAALRVEHLRNLGVTAVQLLPIDEFQTEFSLGYNGTDYFSPEMDYAVHDDAELQAVLDRVNPLFAARGGAPLAIAEARGSMAQLKILVDLFHLHGLAVVFDVVYNHAGGDFGDRSIYYFDRQHDNGWTNSLYFMNADWAGGLVFDFTKPEVRQFLIDNARFYLDEYRADGLRYDEVSVIDAKSPGPGWSFCQDLTRTVRAARAEALQNAEYWPVNPWVVRAVEEGGAGFDTTQHDALRIAVRNAIEQASHGMSANVNMTAIGDALRLDGFAFPWQAVPCVENHDVVYAGREPRIAALADGADHRSWYARSRSRVATALALTSPGIPMLFMGQELLEDKPWSDSRNPATLVWWGGLDGGDATVRDFVRFTAELIALRWRFPALRRARARVLHVHDANRVLVFERDEVVVVVSLNDATFPEYRVRLPFAGTWTEVFNSDVYDHYPNPLAAGNGGRVVAAGDGTASLTIPANSVLVLARP
jgi:1,4-alpha-glucan branching enzyme